MIFEKSGKRYLAKLPDWKLALVACERSLSWRLAEQEMRKRAVAASKDPFDWQMDLLKDPATFRNDAESSLSNRIDRALRKKRRRSRRV